MSGLPSGSTPPRRPKPRPDGLGPRTPRPEPEPEGAGADDASTFRPNPTRRASADDASTFRPNPKRAEAGPGDPAAPRLPKPTDPGKGPTWWERIFFGRVSTGQLAVFCRQFAAYLNAGVDIGKAVSSLQTQFSATALGPVLGRLSLAVRRGDSMAEALGREPQAFDPLFLSMIRVAEARGGVPETLKNLGKHYEARQSLIRQARSAMIYPLIVLFMVVAVGIFLSVWLLPMFAELLRDIAGKGGGDLPLPSRMLMAFSDFIRAVGWFVIPAAVVGLPFALLRLYATAGGKRVMDHLVLWVPGFGLLLRKIDTARFAQSMAALLDAGVDVGSSLDLTSDVMRLAPYRKAVRDCKGLVLHGGELSEALGASQRFAPDVIAVVSSGEETGKLPETLHHLAKDYEEQVAHMVKNMGQLVQPLVVVLMGGLVLFIILAVFLPYLKVLTSLSGGG